jgi:glycerophosphoryl diester phosphodiesterase
MKIFLAVILVGLGVASVEAAEPVLGDKNGKPDGQLHCLVPKTTQQLQALFKFTGEALPVVSAHRGGPARGYPENCLATFEHTLAQTYSLLEVDPRYTKDGQIVLYHDPSLGRTSEGEGRVIDLTLDELKKLKLKDSEGNLTEHTMPTLDEALEWARGRTILVLDQKDVPIAARVKKIEEHKAEGYTLVITGSYKDVAACYKLNPKIMMEVMIPSREKVAEFDKLGVPWSNVVAFVGHNPPEDLELYKQIHERGACCMIGTSRNLDRRFIKQEVAEIKLLETDYRTFIKRGADLIETEIPVPLGQLLYEQTPVPEGKKEFFLRR